jgi:general secretion pathway protein G
MRRENRRGFTLIELLVVVGIIGILAAIAIYNYRGGLERARQKRTMADMRTIAQAWEAKGAETHGYNAAGFTFPSVVVSEAALESILVPTYAKSIPGKDGWGRDWGFGLDQAIGGPTASSYAIRSGGSDFKFDASYTIGPTSEFDCDIVYANGAFVAYPGTK